MQDSQRVVSEGLKLACNSFSVSVMLLVTSLVVLSGKVTVSVTSRLVPVAASEGTKKCS